MVQLPGRWSVLLLPVFLAVYAWAGAPVYAEKLQSTSQDSIARRQKAELMNFFLKDPEQAELPQTPIGVELYNQAVGHFQRQDYDLARQALTDSIGYDPRNAYAFELLGDIDYIEHHLQEARVQYRKAFVLKPSQGLREKLEKLAQELAKEPELATFEDENFILKYEGTLPSEDTGQITQLLKETYRSLSAEFGYAFKQPVIVLLYDREGFEQITQLPHWVTGVYDGKIRLPAYQAAIAAEELKAGATHEMTHAFVAAMSGRRAPAWINEGLAEYEESRVREKDLIVFKAAVRTGTLLPFDQLMNENEVLEETDTLFVALFYEQSFQLVRFLVERHGMFKIKQLLETLAQGKDSHDAMVEIFKMTPDQLEQEWKTTISG